MTAVAPSTSGTPAATSAPNATSRMISISDEGDALRVLAVLRVLGGDRLGGRGVAELLDAHAGMRLLGGGHRGERLVDELLDVLVVPGSLKVTSDRAAVRRRPCAAAGSSVDARDPLQAADDVRDGGGHRDRRLALDEHLLAGLLGEARGLDEHVAALGLAVARRRLRRGRSGRSGHRATVARTTNTIQPRMAVLRCWALQRPARAARFREFMSGRKSHSLQNCKRCKIASSAITVSDVRPT